MQKSGADAPRGDIRATDRPPAAVVDPTDFLGRLAHDLRGPLSPLQTAAYLLRRDDVSSERRGELVDIIDRQATRLGGMLQEVSDWMRVQQSTLVGRRERISVPMLVELACAELAAAGGSIDLPEALDEVEVLGDTQQLVQVLGSVVAYARSISGDGRVEVGASLEDGRVCVLVQPRDTPPGQPEADLFQTPQQSPFDEGLGLRLLIARAVAEAHGGTMDVHSAASGERALRIGLPVA